MVYNIRCDVFIRNSEMSFELQFTINLAAMQLVHNITI